MATGAKFEVREVFRLEHGPSIVFAGRIVQGTVCAGMTMRIELGPSLYWTPTVKGVEYIDRVSVGDSFVGLVCAEEDAWDARAYADLCPPGTVIELT
jgi:hypothetical protein